jgi:hypothetical protein
MTAARSAPHPDWPPICLGMIKVLLAGEVRRDDIETARRFMGDLVGHPDLMARAREMEAAAVTAMAAALPKRPRAPASPRARPVATGPGHRGLFG